MAFVHEEGDDFDQLIRIVAVDAGLAVGLVEKDYWVTHALWALQQQGFGLWLKGGTSLSKGFNLIERFSEDLDLKLESGTVAGIPSVTSWNSESKTAIASRHAYFEALASELAVPGAVVATAEDGDGLFRVAYPGRHLAGLEALRPFVLLEVGDARVTPFVACDMTSFVHDHLERIGQLDDFEDNRPRAVRCVHPLVTLLEKIEALQRRAMNADRTPAAFVRHYEDAARIIGASNLPPVEGFEDARALATEMLATRDIRELARASDPAFNPDGGERWQAITDAYEQIAPMFWGERVPLEDACAQIRDWLMTNLD